MYDMEASHVTHERPATTRDTITLSIPLQVANGSSDTCERITRAMVVETRLSRHLRHCTTTNRERKPNNGNDDALD